MIRQRGIAVFGVLFGGVLVVVVSILLVKLVPAYIEYGVVKKVVNEVAKESIGIAKTNDSVRKTFDKYLSVNGIEQKTITSDDLTLDNRGMNGVDIRFSYLKKVSFSDSVYLGIIFSGESDKH